MCGQPVGAVDVPGGAQSPPGQPAPSGYSPATPPAPAPDSGSETQWLWEDAGQRQASSAPAAPPRPPAPLGGPPNALPPAGNSGPGAGQWGPPPPGAGQWGPPPPAPTAPVQQPGALQPWSPQGSGGGPPDQHEHTATMPGIPAYGSGGGQWGGGPGTGDPWVQGGGQFQQNGGGQWGQNSWPQQPGRPARRPGGKPNPLANLQLPKSPVVPAIGVAALIIVVAAGIAVMRGNGSSQQAGNTTPAPSTPTSSAAASPTTNPQEQQQASQLNRLLSESGGDRGDVNRAYLAVMACKALPADQGVFAKAASNRQNLVTQLQSLSTSALNPAMIQALNGAWTASAQADSDYANWAASLTHGCKKGQANKSPVFKASFGPDGTATTDKQKFTQLWNPLAGKDGLNTYQPGDL